MSQNEIRGTVRAAIGGAGAGIAGPTPTELQLRADLEALCDRLVEVELAYQEEIYKAHDIVVSEIRHMHARLAQLETRWHERLTAWIRKVLACR